MPIPGSIPGGVQHTAPAMEKFGQATIPEDLLKAVPQAMEEAQTQIKQGVSTVKQMFTEVSNMVENEHLLEHGESEMAHLKDVLQREGFGAAIKTGAKDALEYATASPDRANRLERGVMGVLKGVSAILFGVFAYVKLQILTGFLGVGAAAYALYQGKSTEEALKILKDVGLAPSKVLINVLKSAYDDFVAAFKGTPAPRELKAKFDALVTSMDSLAAPVEKGKDARLERATLGVSKVILGFAVAGPYAAAQLTYGIIGGAMAFKAWMSGQDTSAGVGVAAAPSVWAFSIAASLKNDFVSAYQG